MTILLVDDDTGVIQSLLAVLKAQPAHEVRVATNGQKALDNAEMVGGVDLLITDVVMSPMDGFTLRDELVARYPQMRTIFITGYDLSGYSAQTQHHQVLIKPIEPAALLAAIQRELPESAIAETALHVTSAPQATARRDVSGAAAGVMHTTPAAPLVSDPGALPVHETQTGSAVSDIGGAESLLGHTIGAYQILSQLGEGRWGTVYAAVQTSINRPVGLKVLDRARAADPGAKARFIGDARAKAHVQHPSILSVYEAGEADGRVFYAHEYVDGLNLAEMQAAGRTIDEPTALRILRTVGEGLAYLHARGIPHSTPDATSIYLGVDGQPRLANLATQSPEAPLSTVDGIQALGRAVLAVSPAAQHLSPGLRALLGRMVQTGENAITNWGALLQGVKALEPKVVPLEAAKISAQDRAAIEAVEAARRQQKRSLWLTVGTMAATLAAVVGVVWFYVFRSNERSLDEQIAIPAGTYLVRNADTVELEAFWIDKYEVTIGQYATFLAYLESNPTADAEFNHPRQPRHLEHRPADWDIYYGRARAGKPVRSIPTDLNSPMIMCTWWDAYAYAKWKGRELPTEDQWEAAARGPKGFTYPWGDEFDPKKVNSNQDFNAQQPGAKGVVDGYNFWNPVDAIRGDRSPFGVIGMAGNVSEWTATWTPDNRFPIIKGGNFMSADVRLDKRSADHEPSKPEEHIGFRTISKTPPGK